MVHMAHDITQQKKNEELTQKMLELSKQVSSLAEASVRAEPAPALSEQEKHVLRLFAEGKDSDEVASTLSISPQTLRNHLHHINQKLRTHNRLEAVMNAIQRKLI
jgi:DNA-binding CsgD family transcriptional regulator